MVSMSQQVSAQESWSETQGASARASGTALTLGADGREILIRTVKTDVIPLLVAMPWIRAKASEGRPVAMKPQVGAADTRKLIALCLDSDGQAAGAFVAALYRSGVPAESIYEDLLTPVARDLGDMWENDTCTFADVTIALLRLQNAQRALTTEFVGGRIPSLGAPRALMLPVPGEQHTFGLSIVLDYFLRAGWEARLGPVGTEAAAIALVKRERTDLVGLSFACDDHLPTAKALIAAMRRASANRNVVIMVGGPSFSADPGLAHQIGADATALDGHQAVLRANELLHLPMVAA